MHTGLEMMPLGIMFGLGPQELIIILLIVLVLFGATKVPQLMRGLGQGVREFKDAVSTPDDETQDAQQTEGKSEDPPAE